ncbi:MAG: hypothetical protein GEV07_18680 [Streptosporangiales bacterium]|nr:hypothetical protein [Streptosporangiales bacterium]
MSGMKRSVALVVAALLTLAGCGGGSAGGGGGKDEIRIGKQFGIGYAPLVVLEHKPELLKKHLPGVKLTWKELGAGTSLRDAMLGEQLDVGSGGAGPVVDGLTKGVNIKIATGLVEMPMWAVSTKDGPKKLSEFGAKDKIALPGINSSQHVVLREALKREGIAPKRLDDNLVPMPHPDARQAFTADQISAHVTSAPFQYQEVAEGGNKLVDSYQLWGRHTFMTVYATTKWAKENPENFKGLVAAVNEATEWIGSHKAETAKLLAEESGGETPAKDFREQLDEPTVTFTPDIKNIKPMADAMYDLGFIKKKVTAEELFFPSAKVEGSDW